LQQLIHNKKKAEITLKMALVATLYTIRDCAAMPGELE